MQEIGVIARLQIQRSSLKLGDPPRRRYDPAPHWPVPAARLSPEGVAGVDGDARLIDVHNSLHPKTKHKDGRNGNSLGFTAHYAAMRDQFGDHLSDGIAGENLLIATARRFTIDDLSGGIAIETGDGDLLELRNILVAAPCVEFTRYALRFPDDATPDASVTSGLQFLHHGMRGFYAAYAGDPATIRVGNRVFITATEEARPGSYRG
jgi:hypothetical protein